MSALAPPAPIVDGLDAVKADLYPDEDEKVMPTLTGVLTAQDGAAPAESESKLPRVCPFETWSSTLSLNTLQCSSGSSTLCVSA